MPPPVPEEELWGEVSNFSPLTGFYIQVSQALRGSKRAVRMGDTIFLSPAMYELAKAAEGEELKRLLGQIPLLELPKYDFLQPLPMQSKP